MESNGLNYAWPITSVNALDYDAFKKWIEEHRVMLVEKEVIIFGAGIRGTSFLKFFENEGVNNIVFTDNNKKKVGGHIDGSPIISIDDAYGRVRSNRSIIVVSTENCNDIVAQIKKQDFLENRDFYTISTNEYNAYVDEFLREYDCKYLFMGDCEYSNISLHDIDRRNLAEMIRDEFGFALTKILAIHGMHLRSQYHIFEQQIRMEQIPKHLFLMVNLDTLTGKQHLLPRSQHSILLNMIWEACGKNEQFGDYVRIAAEREKNIKAEFLIKGRNSTNEALIKAQHTNYFRLNYMYKMKSDVEGVVYLRKFAMLCEEKGIKFIPFIPPVNYQYAQNLLKDDFMLAYKKNIDILTGLFDGIGVSVLDLSYILESDMFAEPNTPDETANDRGRHMIVDLFKKEVEIDV